jgi:Putative F0F1-ATPase subunit Ca2+/Mg2+ transporter
MNRRRGQDGTPETPTLVILARMAGIGWYVAVSITGGVAAGAWLDGRLGTRPALTIAGVAVGLIVAFLGIIGLLKWFAAGGGDAGGSG